MCQTGISPRTATGVVSRSIGGTIHAETKAQANSSAPASISSCEPTQGMLSLFGEITSTTRYRRKRALNARSSATKARANRQSLSDRLTKSLITAGLIKGTTPRLVRKTLGLSIQDFASLPLGGGDVDTPKMAS